MKKEKDFGYKPYLHDAIHEIVENQIREGEPKETKENLDRLMNLGYTRHEAIHKIGAVIVEDIYNVLKNKQEFDEEGFVKKLLTLKQTFRTHAKYFQLFFFGIVHMFV